MEPNTTDTNNYSTYPLVPKWLQVLLWVAAAIIVVGMAYIAYNKMTDKPETVSMYAEEYGLEESLPADTFLSDHLYFLADVVGSDKAETALYSYSFADDFASIARSDNETGNGALHSDELNEMLKNINTTNQITGLAISTEGKYAYSELVVSQDATNPDSWQVVLVDASSTPVTIAGAMNPQFFHNRPGLLYMKSDGIYRYDFYSGESQLVADTYSDLKANDEFAVSPDDSMLIFTSPNNHLISVQEMGNNGVYGEVGTIVSQTDMYSGPAVAPDGRFYSVLATSETESEIEVRSLWSREVITTHPLTNFVKDSIEVIDWLN